MSAAGRKLPRVRITEVLVMRRLYEQENHSLQQVATSTGRSLSTVYRHLLAVGVTMRPTGAVIHRHPRALSDETIERTVELYSSGLNCREVGAVLGHAESTIRWRLGQAGVHIRSRSEAAVASSRVTRMPVSREAQILAMLDAGATYLEVVAAVGVCRRTVGNVKRRYGRPSMGRSASTSRGRALRSGRIQWMLAPDPLTVEAPGPRLPGKPRRVVNIAERVGFVTSAPLACALSKAQGGRQVDDLCRQAGINPRQFLSWRTGQYREARFDVADRVLVGLDLLWFDVYDPQAHGPGVFADRQRDDVLAWLDAVDRAALMWDGEPAFDAPSVPLVLERAA